jgi:Flp pilus assembly protein TadB
MSAPVDLVLIGLCGAAVGLGVWVGVAGWLGYQVVPDRADPRRAFDALVRGQDWSGRRGGQLRAAAGVGLAVAALLAVLTGMPVLGLLAAGMVWVAVETAAGPSVVAVNRLGGAVAAWCETIRQELDAGQPLRAAVVAAGDLPPRGLEEPLRRLNARLELHPLPDALWAFAREVRHPAVGQIVAAIEVAYRLGAGDLPRLMAGQVETTRHRVQVLRDLHAGRAKHRRAMVMLLGLFLASIVVLLGVWPAFLDAYRPVEGQLVLGGIGLVVLGAVRALVRLSQPSLPPDFFDGRRGSAGAADAAAVGEGAGP